MEFVHDGLARDGNVHSQHVVEDAEKHEQSHDPPTNAGGAIEFDFRSHADHWAVRVQGRAISSGIC